MTEVRRARAPLPVWAGAAAFVCGALWVSKSAAILLTGHQPDHAFELAIACFGVAAFGLAEASAGERSRSHRTLLRSMGAMAVVTGVVASASYLVQGTGDGLFGPATLLTIASAIVISLLTGRRLVHAEGLGPWRRVPSMLGWGLVLSVPAGAGLSSVDERLLEVPLLVVGVLWCLLLPLGLPDQGASPRGPERQGF